MQTIITQGRVHLFDANSNEGLIKLADGSNVYFHGNSLDNASRLLLNEGDKVLVRIVQDTTFRQVSKLVRTGNLDALQVHNELRHLSGKLIGE